MRTGVKRTGDIRAAVMMTLVNAAVLRIEVIY
jgi:hypothetical protein